MKRELVPIETIARRILAIRGHKVLLDSDLAELYGVPTKVLNQAVKRNRQRFPLDFMFQLKPMEAAVLRSRSATSKAKPVDYEKDATNRSQFVTSAAKHRGPRHRPFVFTEQGVAMLSSVLHSERAVRVNIAIMRAFVKLRRMLDTNRELARQFAQLEARVGKQDAQLDAILEAIRELMEPASEGPQREIGFHVREEGAGGRLRGLKLER